MFYFVTIKETINGYEDMSLHVVDVLNEEHLDMEINLIIKSFYDEEPVQIGKNKFSFFGDEIIFSLYSYRQIPKNDFLVLKKYL